MSAPVLERPRVDFGDRFARRKRRFRVAIGVLVALLLAGAVWLVWLSPVLAVASVRVVGAEGPPAQVVLDAAGVPLDVPLARVDTGAAQARVLDLPWVLSVEVRRGWPREVVIAVTPRAPIANLIDGQRRSVVDAEGVVFEAPQSVPRKLPSVRATGVALVSAMEVLAALPDDLARRVVSLSATTRDNVDLHLRSGDLVHWGSSDQALQKAEVLRAVMHRKADVYDVTAPELPTTFRSR